MFAYEGAALGFWKCARNLVAASEAASQVTCTEFVNLDKDVTRHCSQGRIHEALILLSRAVEQGIWHSIKLYSCLMKACIGANALLEGKQVHNLMIECGYDTNIFLENTLIDMYGKCGSLCDASHIFNSMQTHNVYSYTAIISAFTMHNESESAVKVFQLMQSVGLMPDKFVFPLVLKACGSIGALAYGRHAHSFFIVSGLEPDSIVLSALIDMYAKCSIVSDSRRVFNIANDKDATLWTSMIACYAQEGDKEAVFQLFNQMQMEGVKPNTITCLTILQVCSSVEYLREGKKGHVFILGSGMQLILALTNKIVDMYVKCNSMTYACRAFSSIVYRDVVSWNVMVTAYVEAGLNKEAVISLEKMQKERVTPNQLTYVAVLKGCVQLANVELGMQVHACIIENFAQVDDFLQSNLVSMYAKCNSLKDAQTVIDDMDKADVVSWTAVIAGYCKDGQEKEALALFQKMKSKGIEPDELATVSSLKACAAIGALQDGKRIHKDIMKSSLRGNMPVKNALIDMYAKCGSLIDASDVFASIEAQDTSSWNVLISAYAQQGTCNQALQYYDKMLDKGVKPDATTFIAVLSACRHAGLVERGHGLFESMSQKHDILPTMDHYACMVDLLCRVGHVDEAEDFIRKMEVDPGAQVWLSLLGGCRCRGHIETAKRAFRQIKELNPALPGAYVTLANMFATAGMWKDLAKVRKEMDLLGLHKQAEHTYIEVEGEVCKFSTADRSHPRTKDIQAELKRLSHMMKEAGYEPNVNKRLECAGGDEEGDASCEHSERLAVAFGFISTSPGTPIRITKNLKICGDCHAAFRLVSDKEGREIHARDSSRFHHFKNGICSCGDYW